MKLYQRSKTGKVKFLDIKADGDKLVTEWGQLGGKTQLTVKVCKPMNLGKANERTAEEQAIAEMESKITLKKKEGYVETPLTGLEEVPKSDELAKIDLDRIPSSFCPVKPISKWPGSELYKEGTLAQRKHNGHCVFLVKGKNTEHVYSRRMEDLTEVCKELPFIREQLEKLPLGAFVMTEVTYTLRGIEIPKYVARVIRRDNPHEAMEVYKELSKEGTFHCRPFDILFQNHVCVGNQQYPARYNLLQAMKLNYIVEMLPWNEAICEIGRTAKWEGFVLRDPAKSEISYTMDGKAHRQGSYKYKFTQEGDFVVDEALIGKSGKHSNFYSKFHIIEYDKNGKSIDRGYVGPGTLDHEELADITARINKKKLKLPFVVEIEYQSIHDETGKLEFGIIQRLREDKSPKDCIYED